MTFGAGPAGTLIYYYQYYPGGEPYGHRLTMTALPSGWYGSPLSISNYYQRDTEGKPTGQFVYLGVSVAHGLPDLPLKVATLA